jgi:hypothetical protein
VLVLVSGGRGIEELMVVMGGSQLRMAVAVVVSPRCKRQPGGVDCGDGNRTSRLGQQRPRTYDAWRWGRI